MRYVLLGKLNPEWIDKGERFTNAKAKAEELGVTIETVLYTQGSYDFVDVISTDDPTAAVAFSAWYAAQGYGAITTMPAFSTEEFGQAIENI